MTPLLPSDNPGLFKIAQFRRWMVLATGSQLIDDIRRAPDNVLSVKEPVNEVLYVSDSVQNGAHILNNVLSS
jgi:hypothetical protein